MTAQASIGESLLSVKSVEPWGLYEDVRARGGIVWDDEVEAWLVASHALLKSMLRDDIEVWRQPNFDPGRCPRGIPPESWAVLMLGQEKNISYVTGEEHTRMHRWWIKTFSPRVVKQWRDTLIRPLAESQTDSLLSNGNGKVELYADFVVPLVGRTVAALMGFPVDEEWVKRFMDLRLRQRAFVNDARVVLNLGFDPHSAEDQALIAEAVAAVQEMRNMLLPVVQKAKSADSELTILSIAWDTVSDLFGDDYDESDILHIGQLLPEAAVGATSVGAANMLHLLATHNALQADLRANEDRVALFVDEALRLHPPSDFRPRIAEHDTELGGMQIKQGQTVIAMLSSGNRDPARHGCPADIDLERPFQRDHFSFFQGPRSCVGQGLARLQMQDIATVLLRRTRSLRLDPAAEQPQYTGLQQRQWSPLHCLFDAAA